MLKGIFLILGLCGSMSYAVNPSADLATSNPPSEASIKQLLETAQARKMVDSVMAQMETFMKQAMLQATQGQQIPPKVQKDIDKRQAELMTILKEMFEWNKLEPMYLRIYQKSFSQQEVDGMIAFYQTPAGQAVINKMPVVMQNTMNEMQQMMGPMMQKIQRMQQEVVAEMKAEGHRKGG